jgi:hypothetical protein
MGRGSAAALAAALIWFGCNWGQTPDLGFLDVDQDARRADHSARAA